MKRTFFYFALLCIVTYGGVVPYFCVSRVYSAYFVESNVNVEDVVRQSNEQRVRVAERYLQTIDKVQRAHGVSEGGIVDLVIAVKTVDRTAFDGNPYTGYLTQTVTALDRQIALRSNLRVSLIVCNTDPTPSRYDEARKLTQFYPTQERWGFLVNADSRRERSYVNRRNTEKEDYAYCLRAALRYGPSKYVMIVEDDAEPYEGFLNSLTYVLDFRVKTRVVAGEPIVNDHRWAYLRLYFPEKWAGYSWEVGHLCELIGVGSIGGSIAVSILYYLSSSTGRSHRSGHSFWLHFGLGASYAVILVLTIGRQHVMQLRRLLPAFLTVGPANRCCTPAVVYPAAMAEEIVRYLANITCTSSFGVDLALDRFAQERSYDRYLVQPNLVHHRGAYSTLTKPKILKDFLFDS